MKFVAALLISLFVSSSFAANHVPDGTYSGKGTWQSSGPAGDFSGALNLSWIQNGEFSENAGTFLLGGSPIQQYNDFYKFTFASGVQYTMSRLQNSNYVAVGDCIQNTSGYSCQMTQDTPTGLLEVRESGFMQDCVTLVRMGTTTAADGTITIYSVTLKKH